MHVDGWLKNINGEIVLKHTFENTKDDIKDIESYHTDVTFVEDDKIDPCEKLLNSTNSLVN